MLKARHLKVLIMSAIAMGAITAVSASSASAAFAPAKFEGTGMSVTTTGVTVERSVLGSPKTCTMTGSAGGTIWEGNFAMLSNGDGISVKMSCTGSTTVQLSLWLEPEYNKTTGAARVRLVPQENGFKYQSPYGEYMPIEELGYGSWTNGSGATLSTMTFSKAVDGVLIFGGGEKLTLTGSFKAKNQAGTALKIVP